jgi:hypothetical protein
MKPLILDVNAFTAPDELEFARRWGFEVLQTTLEDVSEIPTRSEGTLAILRCERLEKESYAELFGCLREKRVTLINDPDMSERASEFSLHYPLIRAASPRSTVVPSSATATDVLAAVDAAGLKFPIFIKTERKSLKDKSLVKSGDSALKTVLEALRSAFSPFKTFVIKEVVPLEANDSRGFIYRNSLVTFDTGPLVGVEAFARDPIYHFLSLQLSDLAAKRFANFYIIDVTRRTDSGTFIIVEIKDAQFTKVKRPDLFWSAFSRMRT